MFFKDYEEAKVDIKMLKTVSEKYSSSQMIKEKQINQWCRFPKFLPSWPEAGPVTFFLEGNLEVGVKKLKLCMPFHLVTPVLGNCPEKINILGVKESLTQMFASAL